MKGLHITSLVPWAGQVGDLGSWAQPQHHHCTQVSLIWDEGECFFLAMKVTLCLRLPFCSKEKSTCSSKRTDSLLFPSCRLFGGLTLDVKRKAPWFWSDFRDGLSLQCLASFLFLYCACMSPVITFGGLLGEATNGHIVSTSLCWGAWGRIKLRPKSLLQ